MFIVNPPPLCVLDEVDAPLDDANVERFCNLLDEMTKLTDTRFLVITHHALTMSRMNRLFGVTMAERGVSQLVSVTLAEAEKVAAEYLGKIPGYGYSMSDLLSRITIRPEQCHGKDLASENRGLRFIPCVADVLQMLASWIRLLRNIETILFFWSRTTFEPP